MDYLIAGGTGMVGAEIIAQLDRQNDARIFALGRRAPELKSQKVHFVQWDFSSTPSWQTLRPVKPVAICTLGTTIKVAGSQEAFRKVDFDYVVRFAEEAQALGALSLHVVTAHGASATSSIFYNRVKGELEQKLQTLKLSEVHIYRPSLLLGHRREHRPGEGAATAVARVLGPLFKLPGLNQVQPTPADRLAAYILKTAQNPRPGFHTHSNYEIMSA